MFLDWESRNISTANLKVGCHGPDKLEIPKHILL